MIPRCCFFVVLVLLLPTVFEAAAPTPTVQEVLDRHCRAREAANTLKMEFVETRFFTIFDEKETSRGNLYFSQPDRICWRYSEPDRSFTVLSGERGCMVFPDIKQVQTFNLKGSKAETVLSIVGFGSCGPLTESFEVSMPTGTGDGVVLEMIPIDDSIAAMSSRIDLTLDPADYLPRKIEIHERSGDVLLFEFSNLKRNIKLDETMFEFAVPDGYSVVEY